MADIQKIKIKYPELFKKLEIELPSNFFSEPEKLGISERRKYNNIVSDYLCKSGNIMEYKDFQMILIV